MKDTPITPKILRVWEALFQEPETKTSAILYDTIGDHKAGSLPHSYSKISSRWIKDLKIMRKQMKKRKGGEHGRIKKNNFGVSLSKCDIKFKSHKLINLTTEKLGISAQHTWTHSWSQKASDKLGNVSDRTSDRKRPQFLKWSVNTIQEKDDSNRKIGNGLIFPRHLPEKEL